MEVLKSDQITEIGPVTLSKPPVINSPADISKFMKYNEELNVAASEEAFKPLAEVKKSELLPQPIIQEKI